ncbi:MAG TPA: T9SS type A sorting domain-containing protein, partial [Bacteroidales bacterium]|nr:T9SS type A sorting domain-containing protein [Bacteroidales bacterium]
MPNGYGLHGEYSSLNSALIVPHPGNSKVYYIFTTPSYGGAGLSYTHMAYSEVNMSLQNGLGDVTEKNIELIPTAAEQLGAVYHKNNTDFWVVGHELNNDKFYAFRIDNNGISNQPVISEIGVYFQSVYEYSVSGFKFSPSGCKAVSTYPNLAMFQIFDFDNEQGKLFNPISIEIPWPWSASFSPDCKYLYVGIWDTESEFNSGEKVMQFNVSLSSAAEILSSRRIVSEDITGSMATLQLAHNGKIYCSVYQSNYLAVIHEPNEFSVNCNFEAEGLYLAGATSLSGITNFVESFVKPKDLQYDACPSYQSIHKAEQCSVVFSPNPFSDIGKLYFDRYYTDINLVLYDMAGKKVQQIQHVSGEKVSINRNHLEKGVYILQVIANGSVIDMIKLVID